MAAPQGEGVAHFRLERRRANLLFSSWRLSSSIAREQGSLALPSPAAAPTAADTDYVTARHAALLNALTQQPRGCYVFLEDGPVGGDALALHQLELGEPGAAPALHRVCGLPGAQQEAAPAGLTAGSLPPSVVEVQTTGSLNGGTDGLLLVSSGRGDVSLVVRPASWHAEPPAAAGVLLSAPAWPLRPPPPLQGVRPVHLAAAFVLPQQPASAASGGLTSSGGDDGSGQQQQAQRSLELCCILCAGRPRSERQPSRCEVYAVHLAAALAGPEPALQVVGVQLLKLSHLPPHGVLANPATGGVLLALQPSSADAEEEAAAERAAAPAAAPPAGEQGQGGMEEDDVSPRSLAAAVARLAAYTSEEPVGPLPHQQYADLYRESGSDGVGAMGSEPTCTLFTFALAAGAADAAGTAGAARQGQLPLLRLAHTLSCQPHKLLTCHLQPPAFGAQEPPTPDTHLPEGGRGAGGGAGAPGLQQQGGAAASPRPTLLLGLTDDVDCAVVAVTCSSGSDGDGSSGGGQGGAAAAGFVVQHVSSIPAMAYVAAGKVQRKFLLLAPPGGDIAAALVEASKYCYLYRSTAPRQEHGEHQVVDMELPDAGGRGVLGAALAGSRAGACRLVVLAREGLRVIDM